MVALTGFVAFLALAGCSSKPKYPTCSSEKDCKEGEKCIDRKCVQCGSDADCGAGMECKANASPWLALLDITVWRRQYISLNTVDTWSQ